MNSKRLNCNKLFYLTNMNNVSHLPHYFLSLSLREHVRGKVLWWRCMCEPGTVYQSTTITSLCRKVGRQQSLFCECMCWGVTAVILWLLCVYLSTSLQGSLVCCVLACEWVPGTATISAWSVCACVHACVYWASQHWLEFWVLILAEVLACGQGVYSICFSSD